MLQMSPSYCSSPPPLSNGFKRKMIAYLDDEEEEEQEDVINGVPSSLQFTDDEGEEEVAENVKPIGNVVRISGTGQSARNHYNEFQADGVSYLLEDAVLVVPDEVEDAMNTKPSVAIIKDISATQDGKITVTGQRFYRLEIAENEAGEKWISSESRELFYSFDKIEFPADSVMHKCRVHFIPSNKDIPRAKDLPGFIVRKVYDSKYKELTELADPHYDDDKQHEISLLVQKTTANLPSCTDILVA